MRFEAWRRPQVMLFIAALATAGVAQAQDTSWRSFASITPVYQGKGDLDGGGSYSASSAILRAGVSGDLGGGKRAGVTLNYDYTDYAFSGRSGFGTVAPWHVVQRYGVATPFSFALSDGWGLGITPSVDWIRENGADTGNSLIWGAIVAATKHFDNGNVIGFGLGAFDRIEKTSVFPFLLVNWKLSERWRLVNPLPAGPTGPAGLELDYRLDSGWNVGVGAARRSTRFRLSQCGPVPNGIGEDHGIPVFLRATHNFGEWMALNLYAGIVTASQLRIEDPSGNELRRVNVDPAPFVGATFSVRF